MVKLDHINIVVSNLKKAKDFFIQFGFKEKDSSELSGDWISSIVGLENVKAYYVALSLPGSNINIELIEYIEPVSECDSCISKANQIGFRHLAFAVDDIEAEVQKLKKIGIKFLSSVKTYEKSRKKLIYFYGPDGILLELAEYPKLKI